MILGTNHLGLILYFFLEFRCPSLAFPGFMGMFFRRLSVLMDGTFKFSVAQTDSMETCNSSPSPGNQPIKSNKNLLFRSNLNPNFSSEVSNAMLFSIFIISGC